MWCRFGERLHAGDGSVLAIAPDLGLRRLRHLRECERPGDVEESGMMHERLSMTC
jgi:hypothetical protein